MKKQSIDWAEVYRVNGLSMEVLEQIQTREQPDFLKLKTSQETTLQGVDNR